jgi:hypothetical protein
MFENELGNPVIRSFIIFICNPYQMELLLGWSGKGDVLGSHVALMQMTKMHTEF